MKSQDLIGCNKLLSTKKSVIFLANLLQDIAIFKSLIFLLSDELDCNILICMLPGFRKKDHDMYFCDQLRFIANHTNAFLINIESDQDYFEYGIELLIQNNIPIYPIDISSILCMEIDLKEDLELINKKL